MGIHLTSVAGEDWTDPGEGGWAEVAAALDADLVRRGLAPFRAAGAPERFEEKSVAGMAGFGDLCRRVLTREEADLVGGWTVLVPVPLPEPLRLPFETSYDDEAVVAGAPEVQRAAERLASAIALPPEIGGNGGPGGIGGVAGPGAVPGAAGALRLTGWFLDGGAERAAAVRPGPWSRDRDTAFHVALYLRAARHAIRHGCPLVYG
ncbi:hypothetical protein [Streptomyces sp. NPDC089799]|uniref:hypothetical protein n=1 Tax=Streptomyces sp. NPDC089799 TaxID=3155066 RepID=UPI003428643D